MRVVINCLFQYSLESDAIAEDAPVHIPLLLLITAKLAVMCTGRPVAGTDNGKKQNAFPSIASHKKDDSSLNNLQATDATPCL